MKDYSYNYEFKINLDEIKKAKDFVSVAQSMDGEVILKQGYQTVDGSSILGIFTLNLLEDIDCNIKTNTELPTEQINKILDVFGVN